MKEDKVKYFGIIFWLHLILVIFAYSSPFLFNWKLIFIVSILLIIQYKLIGGCFLNQIQFKKTEDITFLYPYLKMLKINVNPHKFKFFIRYILPIILLSIAIIWQVILNKSPLLF